MFHKKRDQSSLTVKSSTLTFTTSCFVSKRCIYQINYLLTSPRLWPICIGLYVLKRLLNVRHIFENIWECKQRRVDLKSVGKDYFGLKCILSYYVPVQTIVSPYGANCVTPLIYPTTDLDFLLGIIVSYDLSFYFLFF